MPSPVGHSLAGLTLAVLLRTDGERPVWLMLLMANAPDVDFVPGLLVKSPLRYHAGASHSLGAACAAAAVAGGLARLRGRRFLPSFRSAAAAYSSHLLLDCLSKGTEGLPLLWPLSRRSFSSAPVWFTTVVARQRRGGFLAGLLTRHNLRAVAEEALLLLPVLLLARHLRGHVL